MKHSIRGKLFALSLLTTLTGASLAGAPASSDFITDLPALQPVPGVEGSWGWEAEENTLQSYDKFVLTNVEVFLAPDSPYKGINGRQIQAITDTLRAAMKLELEPDYPLISQPGPGVAQLSIAITNVKMSKRKKNILQYTPVGLALGGVRSLADALNNVSLAGAVVEAEFTDSVTGERLAVRVATNPWAQAGVGSGEMSWETLESAFVYYAKQVKTRFDALHGRQ